MVVVGHVADLDVIHLVVLRAAELLRLDMFGMRSPGALAFLMFELDDGDAFAVVGPEALVCDVARDGFGDLVHALDQRDVLVLHAGPQTRAEDGDDHGVLLFGCRECSPLLQSIQSKFAMATIHNGDGYSCSISRVAASSLSQCCLDRAQICTLGTNWSRWWIVPARMK